MSRPGTIASASALLLAAALATDCLAAQRVFVASFGNDANDCTLGAPCRSFSAAMLQVDPGGEVVALDAAGYGAVVIGISVTITANPGFYAGIAAASGPAVALGAPGLTVVLRGLEINGVGAYVGIQVDHPGSLIVENCTISNFGLHGIFVAAPAEVQILDSTIRGNGFAASGGGILIGAGATGTLRNARISGNYRSGLAVVAGLGATTTVSVTDSDSSHNGDSGFIASPSGPGSARMSIRASSASHNTIGVTAFGAGAFASVGDSGFIGNVNALMNEDGVMETYGDNVIRYSSGAPTSGTITPVAGQ